MKKLSFTMIEIIFVIVILSLIGVGSFKAIQMLYERYYQVNIITKFTIISQTLLDEVGTILYYRTPLTAIGYSPSDGDFKKLEDVDEEKYSIFEWMSEANDAKKHFGMRGPTYGYTGFIDMDASNRDTLTLVTKDFNITDTNDTINTIFDNREDLNRSVGIIFAGNLDKGTLDSDYNNSFGWHGYQHKKLFLINRVKQTGVDANFTMTSDIENNKIYAKYYLTTSAWGIARGADINKSAPCLNGLNVDDNTLLLFFNYRPWNNETFCADPHQNKTETTEGNVSILARDVTAFRVKAVSYHLELKVQFERPLYRGSDRNITITKQKVVF
jgi:hypothetical protein